MKYKVGDKVRIKSLDWYTSNKDKFGKVWTYSLDGESQICFDSDMIPYCGMETVIFSVERENYVLKGIPYAWTDEMIEGLVEEALKQYEVPTGSIKIWDLPNGHIFKDENGNVINATKIVLEKKKKEYPKTFEECVHVLEGEIRTSLEQMNTFRKLIDARNAYWKIAGDEMGLGKPWEPDYDSGADKFGIICLDGVVQESNPTTNWERHLNKILDFPTKEMRDAFKQNFDPDIEICKEFL